MQIIKKDNDEQRELIAVSLFMIFLGLSYSLDFFLEKVVIVHPRL